MVRRFSLIFSIVTAFIYVSGCSSTGGDQGEADLEAAGDQAAAEEPAAPPPPSTEQPSEAAVSEPAATPAPEVQPAPAAVEPVNTGKSVLYVKAKKTPLRDGPGGKTIGQAVQGDHFLVVVEGEWAKTDDGKYIAMKDLSEKGVGRPRKGAKWKK